MINFKYFSLFIILHFVYINAQFPISEPLLDAQKPLVTDIINLYGLANNDPCSYNIFDCYRLNISGVLQLVVGEINIANVPEGKTYSIADLSPFALSLEYLYINDDKVTIDDSFWNTIDQFTNLKRVRVYKQSSNIASTSFPTALNEIILDNYGGQVSDIFFSSNLESLVINGTLSGFSYGITEFPSNNQIKSLYLIADQTFPTGYANLQSISSFSLRIDNRKELAPFTIPDEFASFENAYSFSFLFTTDNPVYKFPSSIQNVKSLKTLFITGNGFASPSDGSSYDFTIAENIKFDLNGLSNFLSCSAKPCIQTNENSRFSTIGSSYSTDNIDFTNYISVYISGNSVSQTIPEVNYSEIRKVEFVNSQFYGAIPEQYCNITLEKYSFANNKLTSLPNCLVCASVLEEVSSTLLPNSFNVAVPPSTPCLVKQTIKRDTIGLYTIEIEGDALGFKDGYSSTPKTNVIAPLVTLESLNTLLTVLTFPGEGSNNFYDYNFTGSQLQLTVSYNAPVIDEYILDNYTLSFKGSGFSIISRNIVTFVNSRNGRSFSLSTSSYDGVSINISKDFYYNEGVGGISMAQITVADQTSNKVEVIDPDYPSSSSVYSPISILNYIILLSLVFICI